MNKTKENLFLYYCDYLKKINSQVKINEDVILSIRSSNAKEENNEDGKGNKYAEIHIVHCTEKSYGNLNICFYSKYAIVKVRNGKYEKSQNHFVVYDEYLRIENLIKKFFNRDKKKCVVLGGSFNPVTNAHLEMANWILNNKDKRMEDVFVVYVPTPEIYLRNHKKYGNEDILDDETRYLLLSHMSDDIRIIVDDMELLEKREKAKTFQTLYRVKEKYDVDEVYYVIGSDDIAFMNKWWSINDLLSNFYGIVVPRTIKDVKEELNKYEISRKNMDRFIVLEDIFQNKYPHLSSTFVRDCIKQGKLNLVQENIPNGAYQELLNTSDDLLKKENAKVLAKEKSKGSLLYKFVMKQK